VQPSPPAISPAGRAPVFEIATQRLARFFGSPSEATSRLDPVPVFYFTFFFNAKAPKRQDAKKKRKTKMKDGTADFLGRSVQNSEAGFILISANQWPPKCTKSA
jgi:hypothetical protein